MIVPPGAFVSEPLVTVRVVEKAPPIAVSSIAPAFVNPLATVRFEKPVLPSGSRRRIDPAAVVNAPVIALLAFVTTVP